MNQKTMFGSMFGSMLIMIGVILVAAHLLVVGRLIPRGIDPDDYVANGGTSIASHVNVPMGAALIGVGALLFVRGQRKQGKEAGTADANEETPKPIRRQAIGVMAAGMLLMALHVTLLHAVMTRVETIEHDPMFVPACEAFETEKAKTHLDMERINAIFYIGLSLGVAGLMLLVNNSPSKRETKPAE